jgi:hypothetical protein
LQSRFDLGDDSYIEVYDCGDALVTEISLFEGRKMIVKNHPKTKEGQKKHEEFLRSYDTLDKLEKYIGRLKNGSK